MRALVALECPRDPDVRPAYWARGNVKLVTKQSCRKSFEPDCV